MMIITITAAIGVGRADGSASHNFSNLFQAIAPADCIEFWLGRVSPQCKNRLSSLTAHCVVLLSPSLFFCCRPPPLHFSSQPVGNYFYGAIECNLSKQHTKNVHSNCRAAHLAQISRYALLFDAFDCGFLYSNSLARHFAAVEKVSEN
jgi:hypothetical protein